MIKKSLVLFGLASTLLFTGCHEEKKYYDVVDYDQNEVIIEYETNKISTGYFSHYIEEHCSKDGRTASLNYIESVSTEKEIVSYSCILDK